MVTHVRTSNKFVTSSRPYPTSSRVIPCTLLFCPPPSPAPLTPPQFLILNPSTPPQNLAFILSLAYVVPTLGVALDLGGSLGPRRRDPQQRFPAAGLCACWGVRLVVTAGQETNFVNPLRARLSRCCCWRLVSARMQSNRHATTPLPAKMTHSHILFEESRRENIVRGVISEWIWQRSSAWPSLGGLRSPQRFKWRGGGGSVANAHIHASTFT